MTGVQTCALPISGVVFVKAQGDRPLQGPGQHALAEFGDLFAVLEDDGVLADQIDAADVAVQVHADHRPVEPGGDLFDVRRLAGENIEVIPFNERTHGRCPDDTG